MCENYGSCLTHLFRESVAFTCGCGHGCGCCCGRVLRGGLCCVVAFVLLRLFLLFSSFFAAARTVLKRNFHSCRIAGALLLPAASSALLVFFLCVSRRCVCVCVASLDDRMGEPQGPQVDEDRSQATTSCVACSFFASTLGWRAFTMIADRANSAISA